MTAISGIGPRSAIDGNVLVQRLAAMRDATQSGGALGGIQGGDRPRSHQVDIGKEAGFQDTLTRLLNEVSSSQDRASDMTGRFVRGEQVEMHQVMAATEEAGLALEMLVELRNKVTEAYRTLVNMQS